MTRQASGPPQPIAPENKEWLDTPPRPINGGVSEAQARVPEVAAYPVAPNPVPAAPIRPKRRFGLMALLAILVLALVLSAGLVALGFGGKGPFATLGKHPAPTATATPALPPGFALYTNIDHSFKVIYPTSWQKGASTSGTGIDFQGPSNASFIATNLGGNQGDPATSDNAFCALLSGNTSSPHTVTVGGQRWTQETCDSFDFFGNLHAVVETITYKGLTFMIAYSATRSAFANENTHFFSLMEHSFAFLI